jgi:hypothetical protein
LPALRCVLVGMIAKSVNGQFASSFRLPDIQSISPDIPRDDAGNS